VGRNKTTKLNMEEFKIYIILTCSIIGLIILAILMNLYPYITLGAIILGGVIFLRIVGSKNIKWEEDERDKHHFL